MQCKMLKYNARLRNKLLMNTIEPDDEQIRKGEEVEVEQREERESSLVVLRQAHSDLYPPNNLTQKVSHLNIFCQVI